MILKRVPKVCNGVTFEKEASHVETFHDMGCYHDPRTSLTLVLIVQNLILVALNPKKKGQKGFYDSIPGPSKGGFLETL